ncbi:DUF4375 domain-containing protein [Methylopila sp. M107]|uniref:DMP19 family protein n=1 Tax=Methylopila sp. M107 TaxID=1101190 RepID=UPI0004783F6B|nr:DUF4375 domain-containing protein [Methylopila sp. M107]
MLGQLGDETYLETLQGGDRARRKALDAHDEARRRLLELEVALRIWFPERDTAEFLKVFFAGPVGDDAPAMVASLEAMGADRQAKALKAGMALFGGRYPASDKRAKQMGSWDKPSKLGLAVQALAPEFGTRRDFTEALGRYACATESVRDWIAEARSRMGDDERLNWAVHRLVVAYHFNGGAEEVAAGLAKLPEPYRVVYLVRLAAGEVINGGVEQFFSNSSGATATHAVEAFRTIGLDRHADILAKGVAMFPQPYEPDRTKRYAGESGWSARDDALSALTDDWDYDAVERAAPVYARREGIVPE